VGNKKVQVWPNLELQKKYDILMIFGQFCEIFYILFFDNIFDCFTKFSIFDKIFDCFTKFSIIDKIFDFLQNFRFLIKFSIFDKIFYKIFHFG